MSEEQTQETNDGTWSGLKKTIIGTLTTVIAGGGVWVSTLIFGGGDEPAEETKTEQPASQPVINLNVQQNQENKQKTENNNGGGVVRERIIERPAQQPQSQPEKPKKVEEESW
jgi:flagellar basal body-associated protein FliL